MTFTLKYPLVYSCPPMWGYTSNDDHDVVQYTCIETSDYAALIYIHDDHDQSAA